MMMNRDNHPMPVVRFICGPAVRNAVSAVGAYCLCLLDTLSFNAYACRYDGPSYTCASGHDAHLRCIRPKRHNPGWCPMRSSSIHRRQRKYGKRPWLLQSVEGLDQCCRRGRKARDPYRGTPLSPANPGNCSRKPPLTVNVLYRDKHEMSVLASLLPKKDKKNGRIPLADESGGAPIQLGEELDGDWSLLPIKPSAGNPGFS